MSQQDLSVAHAYPMYIVWIFSLSMRWEFFGIRVGFIESDKFLTIFIYLFTSEVKSLYLSS